MGTHQERDLEGRRANVHGGGCFHTTGLIASISRGRLITVTGEDGERANRKGEGIGSTETDALEEVLPGSQEVLTKESPVGELRTPISDLVHISLVQSLKVLRDVL